METKPKVTLELCYQAAVNAGGKTLVDELADQLGIKRAKFMANITEYCIKNAVVLPPLKLDDSAEKALKKLPRVFERGNVKQSLSLKHDRLSAYGMGSYLRFESIPVPQQTKLQIDGVMIDLPLGAVLVYPSMAVPSTVASEPPAEAETEVLPEKLFVVEESVTPEVAVAAAEVFETEDVTEQVANVLSQPSASGAHAREVMEVQENPLSAALMAAVVENPELEKSDGVLIDAEGEVVADETFSLDDEEETVPAEPVAPAGIGALTEALSKVSA